MSEFTKKYYRKKFRTITCSLLDKFAEGVAPGQEKFQRIPEDLRKSLEKYQHSDRKAQGFILLLIDFSKYSQKFLIQVICYSKYKIDKAKC